MVGPRISIVAPTFNEAENIGPLVARVEAALQDTDWELIVVDDDSPDGTAEVARRLALDNHRVRSILRVFDRGLARASIHGMLSAKGDLICVMDADGQHDPRVILRMMELLRRESLDIVSAARRLDVVDPQSLSDARQSLSKLGNRVSNVMLGRKLMDPLTGFFIVRREAFLGLVRNLGDPGFKLLLDILLAQPKLRHGELPFEFEMRRAGESKLDALIAWQFTTFLISKMTRGLLPARFVSFLIVGGSGVFVHLAILYSALGLGASFSLAQACAALVAASSNFFLNNLLTFRDRRLRGARLVVGLFKFLVVSSVGIAANVSAATFAYERLGQWTLPATFAGIALDTIWKFVVSKRIVWK